MADGKGVASFLNFFSGFAPHPPNSKQMAAAIARYDVRGGAFGLVMEVDTGRILAMATLGSYDPNQYLEIYDPSAAQAVEELRLEYLTQTPGTDAYNAARALWPHPWPFPPGITGLSVSGLAETP